MTVLLYIAGVVAIMLGLAISIGLHECGHMIPARRFGVRVPQFFVGFGKTVWSRHRNGTEYGLKAFPLGGFVKIIGMLPPHDARADRSAKPGPFSQLISDARAAEAELIEPQDADHMFYQLPWWKKVIVMAGGPTVNLAIAAILFGGIFAIHGVPETTTTVATVADCVMAVRSDEKPRACVTGKDPVAPARAAGLRKGDKIVAFGSTEITSYPQLQKLIRANGAKAVFITVERDGKKQILKATTAVNELPDLDDNTTSVNVGYLGIVPTEELVSKGPIYTLGQMGGYTVDTVQALGHLPVRLWGVARAAVGLEKRDPESPMSVVGVSRFAGEVASDDKTTGSDKVVIVASLLAGVNLFLGMFNFVPLLPLDGGHIAGALYEALRRGWARLRGRPDPGHFDVARLLPIAYVMAGLLLVMTVILVYADIVAPVA